MAPVDLGDIAAQAKLMKAKKAAEKIDPVKLEKQFAKEPSPHPKPPPNSPPENNERVAGNLGTSQSNADTDRAVPMNPDQISLLTRFLTKIEGGKENPNAAALFSIYCATKIASWFRMIKWRYRFNYKKFPFYTIAALLIQNSWRHSYQQHYLNESSYMSSAIQYQTPEDKYAAKIQNAWRKNSSVKIYKFYRDLINFRLSGDPKMLLKTINPSEASLFDAATKIHIRLRLGGSSFPPCLYYKIFTSAPCSDIGAFAPRNYAESKHLDPDELHNKSTVSQGNFPGRFDGSVVVGKSEFAATGILDGDGTDGWYQRVENNGWRAVTVRAQEELREDSVEIDTAAQTKNKFHFSRLVRKKDIAIMRKKKKRLWLRRMYEIGLAKEVEDGRIDIVDKQAMVTQELMAGGDVGDLKMFTKHMDVGGGGDFLDVGEDGEVDVEVEKLLNWTSDLDYDGYVDEWSKVRKAGNALSVL
ncbi:hypothetical protein TL16_g05840 [Triparma laevis f. inornata]|uniref:Uncharacterized protein n=1 Tax=Triparma laevis f. inornata TaxID=1714386 RepID=A0A9W7AHZ8_9STRA|nr:hypothetical protein TL16_g05840 [Triparma laevis f. inornata]